jgi:very-short-patch-repair endonuclease
MLLVLAGLPEPEVNLEIRDDNGVVVLRFDLSYPSVRLAVEYDGRQHLQDVGQWERDVERRDQVDSTGWRLLTVTSRGLFRDPEDTVTRVREALAARGWRPLPATSDAWRPHFRAVA